MRILIVTRNAWDDTNSIGNTVSNFFGGIPDAEFANLYFRSSMPNNRLCKRYFQVTEKDVLRFWLTPSRPIRRRHQRYRQKAPGKNV